MSARWDAAVDLSRLGLEGAHRAPTPSDNRRANTPTTIEVLLFGALAEVAAERALTLRLKNPFCVGEVIAELGRRLGNEFLSRVTEPSGRKLRHCRVFVNGDQVEDVTAPVQCASGAATIEMILLTAAEGG